MTFDLAHRGRFELVHLEGGPCHQGIVPIEPGQQIIPASDLITGNAEEMWENLSGLYERTERISTEGRLLAVFQFQVVGANPAS